MKYIRNIVCLILVLAMIGPCIGASAATPSNNDVGTKISWDELPDAYKKIISKDADITLAPDGSYDIIQNTPIQRQASVSSIINAPMGALERYEPLGGTYSNFSNSSYGGSYITFLYYQTYIPSDVVGNYIMQNRPNLITIVRDWVLAYGAATAITMLAAAYGITLSTNGLNLLMTGFIYYVSTLDYNSMVDVSGGGANGVLVEYVTTINQGNARVYTRWYNWPYIPTYPNGGTASWASQNYAAMP